MERLKQSPPRADIPVKDPGSKHNEMNKTIADHSECDRGNRVVCWRFIGAVSFL